MPATQDGPMLKLTTGVLGSDFTKDKVTPTLGAISIDRAVAASNGGLGIFVTTNQKITIRRSTSYSNNGTGIYLGTSEIVLEDVVVNANGFFGIHVEVEKRLEMDGVNVSAHRGEHALELFTTGEASIAIANSRFHDNKKGVVRFSGKTGNPNIILHNCRFLRNFGEMIKIDQLANSNLTIDKSEFLGNSYLDFDGGDSVISIQNGNRSHVSISNSHFSKNTMHDVIKILGLETSEVLISSNEFIQNLANSIITTDSLNASIIGNKFQDKRSTCEITYDSPAVPKSEDLVNNKMESGTKNPICTGLGYQTVLMDAPYTSTSSPVIGVTGNPFRTSNGIIKASPEPYLINEEVLIPIGETVVIEPGTILDFAPGVGITVSGQLIMNGTEEKPVVTRGQNGNTWRGIVAKPEGVLDVKNVVSEDASIGIWIDSQKVNIQNGRIIRPAVHGIEITQNSNDVVDLGGVVIEEANESAIGVDERRDDLMIKNARIQNGAGSGVDFMTPTGNIELQNIEVTNMGGYGIHISEFPSSPLHAVLLENVSVTNQKKGHAGILISGGWIQNIGLHNLKFEDNSVPSLIVALECNDGNEKLIKLDNNSFERNTDIVQHVHLGSCANLQMERNTYNENNADGIGSTLVITSESNVKKKNGVMEIVKNNFTNNGGIYTVTLDTSVHDAYFTDNILKDNMNSGAVLKVSGENVKIVTNSFDNKDSKYQISYSDDSPIDATFNEWNGLDQDEVLETIDAKEGAVLVVPYGTTVPMDNQLDPLTTVVPVTVPDSANIKCAHLAYCSRRGTCRDGICICPQGYAGFDCSIPLFCNCSGNGLCNLLNVCMCNEGWTGPNCSIPKCVTSCSGHGKCTAPNLCECDPGWMGKSCSVTSCVDENCVHGHCGSNGLCKCDSGWQGSRCQIPHCTNCSLNGVCTKPGFCSCFEDYGGADCTKCKGDSCEACDFDCNHGICEPLTKTCSCSKGWMGGACDVCAIGKCDDGSKVQYIQPSTAELEDVNTVVNVFGDGFSITNNNSYVCTFGRTSVTGLRVSSALIRCPIPANLTLGRHVFSVSKPGTLSSIGNAEARPIHFTLYDGCEPSLCQGSCVGPLCICPQGKTGVFCDVIEVIPTIDKRFLEHQRANTAFEGVPYVLMLPTLASSVLRVNSTIPNLNFIASKGIVAWPEPIGSSDPYEVTVTAFSPAGETTIAWNITVQPEYAVEVQNVTVDRGKANIKGKLIGPAAASPRKNPVVIRVRRDDTVDEILAESDTNGQVSFDYIPMLPGVYEVTMAHPNVHTDAIQPIRFTIPEINLPIIGESSNSSLTLNITGREGCEVKLIQPKVESPKVQQHGSETIIDFGRFWDGEVLATVRCKDSPMEIVRAPPIQMKGILPTTPEVLSVYGNENLYEIKVHWPPEIAFNPTVTISDSSFDDSPISIPEDKHLRMTFSTVGESIGNGTIQIKDGSNLMATVPYFYAAPNKSQYYTFKICVQDEWDGQEGELASREVATIAIQNPQRGVDIQKTNIRMNVQWAEFFLQPGTYNVLVRSELHEPVEQLVELSPLNTSFCVPLVSSRSRNLPTIHCSHFTDPASCDVAVTSVASADNQLPVLNFEPSVVTSRGQKVLATPRGSLEGTIGLWNSEVAGIIVTPSKRSVAMNESFWITFSWKKDLEIRCDVKTIQVPFVFLPDSSEIPVHSSSNILIRLQEGSNEICDSNDTPVTPATSTLVMCNCGDGARTRCRERYHSATACGGSWNKIADDTVSLEVIASFLAMIFECREVSVDFKELRNSLECVASIESDCPISSRRKREMQNDSPFGIINGLNSNTDFGKVLPVLNALDVQTIRISSVFIEFVDKIQKMFPDDVIHPLDRDAVDRFLGAIADQSDEGQLISEAERRIIGEDAISLIQLWNLTVKSWKSGKVPIERLGITHQDAKQLVAAADRIKSISRQNVAQDPFTMLHGYMERMLETGVTEQKECASSTVFIDKTEVEEDGQMRIQVFIKNRAPNLTF
uniref:EGF-like domain-containing protein n=1 Tax=Caenorhabditis tropicalis TaxID=1561998 RepID=A0A1I7U298_9PELO